jgi:hypothetical protein
MENSVSEKIVLALLVLVTAGSVATLTYLLITPSAAVRSVEMSPR